MSLTDSLPFIAHADGLIAAATGPVHLAANLGIHTLGLYSLRRPCDAGRWGPVGSKAEVLNANELCKACQDGTYKTSPCHCLSSLSAQTVFSTVSRWAEEKHGLSPLDF